MLIVLGGGHCANREDGEKFVDWTEESTTEKIVVHAKTQRETICSLPPSPSPTLLSILPLYSLNTELHQNYSKNLIPICKIWLMQCPTNQGLLPFCDGIEINLNRWISSIAGAAMFLRNFISLCSSLTTLNYHISSILYPIIS